jgi:hypothetical protein
VVALATAVRRTDTQCVGVGVLFSANVSFGARNRLSCLAILDRHGDYVPRNSYGHIVSSTFTVRCASDACNGVADSDRDQLAVVDANNERIPDRHLYADAKRLFQRYVNGDALEVVRSLADGVHVTYANWKRDHIRNLYADAA